MSKPPETPKSLSSKQKETLNEEILRRLEDMIASLGTHGGGRCERCNNVHASIVRAVRYHLARYWIIPIAEQEEEMAFIESLRLALPPGTNVTVKMSEAQRIIREGG